MIPMLIDEQEFKELCEKAKAYDDLCAKLNNTDIKMLDKISRIKELMDMEYVDELQQKELTKELIKDLIELKGLSWYHKRLDDGRYLRG